MRTHDEIRKKQMRRKKRAEEKGKAKGRGGDEKEGGVDTGSEEVKLVDLFEPYLVIRASGKVRSFDFGPDSGSKGGAQVRPFEHHPRRLSLISILDINSPGE